VNFVGVSGMKSRLTANAVRARRNGATSLSGFSRGPGWRRLEIRQRLGDSMMSRLLDLGFSARAILFLDPLDQRIELPRNHWVPEILRLLAQFMELGPELLTQMILNGPRQRGLVAPFPRWFIGLA
jgi:hypothetical protein